MMTVATPFPQLTQYSERIVKKLDQWLPNSTRLHQAMRYAVLNGGKRLRPLLVYATGLAFKVRLDFLDKPAGAVELIHCYSLIHDDLPAMDDDDLRRGMPTCHKQFDEATAILAGDALQSLAFEWLAKGSENLDPHRHLRIIKCLAEASGAAGMAGGQALDLAAEGKQLNLTEIEMIHRLKTGALISASVQMGALAAGCEDDFILHCLDQFANKLGLAFQIQDDILNIEGEKINTGKNSGTDQAKKKATYPQVTDLSSAKGRVGELTLEAQTWLTKIPADIALLQELAFCLMKRSA